MSTALDNAFTDRSFRWDRRKARHLLERAGFGVPPAAVERLAAMKPEEAVRSFVEYERFPAPDVSPPSLSPPADPQEVRRQQQNLSGQEREARRRQRAQQERQELLALQGWWLERMRRTQRPLEEKLTLFWHGHFAVSAQKVKEAVLNYDLNCRLRDHAKGSFGNLLRAVATSPAMLIYLDNRQNSRGRINENWAREFFELFTLGHGHYTEKDIREAARAFTGWTVRRGEFFYAARQHDDGLKTIFGRAGRFDGDDVIELTLMRPECAEFICAKLWRFFAYEDPEPDIVKGLAATVRNANYEFGPVLTQMFSSRAFYSERAMGAQIKSPVQYVIELMGQLNVELPTTPPLLQLATRAMGQELFVPPNVKGWDGGQAWINTNTLLTRMNFASYLVRGGMPEFGGRPLRRRDFIALASTASRSGGGEMPMAEDQLAMRTEPPAMTTDAAAAKLEAQRPAGQDAMAPDNPQRTFREALLAQRRRGRGADLELPPPLRDVRAFFAKLDGRTPPEIVASLESYLLATPLTPKQRQVIVNMLSPQQNHKVSLRIASIPEDRLRAVLQLLLSCAEYQLC